VALNTPSSNLIGSQPVRIPAGNNVLITVASSATSAGYAGYFVAP
jgi:hypothetical protein